MSETSIPPWCTAVVRRPHPQEADVQMEYQDYCYQPAVPGTNPPRCEYHGKE